MCSPGIFNTGPSRMLFRAAIVVCLLRAPVFGVEPTRRDQEHFLSRAAFAENRLWVLSDAGALSTIEPGAKVRVPADLPEPALDLCAVDDVVHVLTCAGNGCANWTLRRRTDRRWTTVATLAAKADSIAALSCAPAGTTTVLTNRRLIQVVDGKAAERTLSEKIETGTVTSIHVTPDEVFVGINAGEWGGGLRVIARKTGKVSVIEKTTGGLCKGPLNTACDPVNAIADAPWKPECVIAAIGLVHFAPHGRLVEICGRDVRRIYFRRLGHGRSKEPGHDDDSFETEAFFGMIPVGKQLVAVGVDGIYRFDGPGAPVRTPLPKFKVVGNIGVSFALPGIALVLTGINQRRSISGNVPMLVPR
ncbi:MAG: hypothetical protein SFV32_01450 [Opitutaceae bacterium]|nr:hypothetical protein [Opitutaceae bacterium]